MTREEEITQAAEQCAHEYGGGNLVQLAFKKGAEWADQHNAELEQLRKENQEQAAWIRKEIEHTQSPLISVEDRLPNEEIPVIVLCSDGDIIKDILLDKYNQVWQFANNAITHWMPIPELSTTK